MPLDTHHFLDQIVNVHWGGNILLSWDIGVSVGATVKSPTQMADSAICIASFTSSLQMLTPASLTANRDNLSNGVNVSVPDPEPEVGWLDQGSSIRINDFAATGVDAGIGYTSRRDWDPNADPPHRGEGWIPFGGETMISISVTLSLPATVDNLGYDPVFAEAQLINAWKIPDPEKLVSITKTAGPITIPDHGSVTATILAILPHVDDKGNEVGASLTLEI